MSIIQGIILKYKTEIKLYRHISFFFQEEEYEQALKKFSNALQITGFKPHLSYNVALSYFKLKEYAASLKHIGKLFTLNYQIMINYM